MRNNGVTQADRTLAYLKTGRTLTSKSALMNLGIISFPKRISELRRRGIKIQSKTIIVQNFLGEPCQVKEYWLEEVANAE